MTKKKPDMINDVEEIEKVITQPFTIIPVNQAAAPTLPPAPIPGLTPGRMVHYVLDAWDQSKHRPAIITNVLDAASGTVNLIVLFDGPNDGRSALSCTEWVPGIEYSEFNLLYTWHFIEKA